MNLGIDISTNVLGICICDENKKIIDLYNITNKSAMSFNEKIDNFFNEICKCIEKYNIKSICIEDALLSMQSGNSTYNTILKLIAFNAIITYLIEKKYDNIKIIKILPIVSRKKAWGKTFTEKYYKTITYDDIPKTLWKKHHIYLEAKNKYDNIDQFMKYNTVNKFVKENYDCIDALTLCLCNYE